MFEEWYRKYDRMIHHLLHHYHITYDRDDYYQLALIRLWQLSEQYDAVKTPNESQYVYLQLKFCLIDEMRRRIKYQERFQLMADEVLPVVMCYDTFTLSSSSLTAAENEWYVLARAGYQLSEISNLMGKTCAQIKYIRKKAREKLRQNSDLSFKCEQ
ncbi:sigma-70 family RNA polymerase sigma factor [Macrococcus hajekii]|uniref:Sigma-70 family RNA polymerase sigma factor n=1 Tax=Macrococcus hajekii TaxID=198482 RepID=A0A4R6BNL3_9STAP|nr:sigma factor [Macrococcus hajekii]TDM03391.1 sigma-70 family RNA polymerase sigma factor [Macrococcus hajekii]GGA98463.1 hypothetical protein GCM10007190_03100 [Macrococcus hajekii]